MADRIIDSKYRVLEELPKIAGRQRCLASDLISGHITVLESVVIDGFQQLRRRWTQHIQPALRERAARFAELPSVVPVSTVGAWDAGPYYVYEDPDGPDSGGDGLSRLPSRRALRALLQDFAAANRIGEHFVNLRPEHLRDHEGRLYVLPGAWIIPIELLRASSARSPYQPPELRHAGHIGPTTDGYQLAGVLQAIAERSNETLPPWWGAILHLLTLEPHRRPSLEETLAALDGEPDADAAFASPRRSAERLVDLDSDDSSRERAWQPVLESLDQGLTHLAEGRSSVVLVEAPASGAGLQELFLGLRERLCLLAERPEVVRVDPLTSLEMRELSGNTPRVILVADYQPQNPELLPLERLFAHEKLRPSVFVVGVRRGAELSSAGQSVRLLEHARALCADEFEVLNCTLSAVDSAAPGSPTSPAARHLLDLFAVLETDATAEMLRMALPQQEADLPEALAELEQGGHLRRTLESGGWWGNEHHVVLRVLRPDALEMRRQSLTVHRREELHLLLSHLLEDLGPHTLAQRYLRFHHLFAGGNWDAAAAECGPLLRAVQRRGLDTLMRQIQRKLVNSNLAHHFTVQHLLEVLRSLGKWEVQRNRISEGRSYYERAAEKLFSLSEAEAAQLDLEGTSDMLLSHADLQERHGEFERALELLQRYLERFDERIPAVERGRLFSEMAYCEYKLGRFGPSEERCQVALKLLDTRRHPQDVAQVYSILGLVRWKTSRYDEAEQYFNSSMALREKTGDRLAMARTYNNLGLLYRSRRRFTEALEYHRKSLEIRQEAGDETGVARNMLNLSWVYFEMNDLSRAEELAQRAWERSDALGSRGLRASTKGLLGEILLVQGRMDEARSALEDAIHQAREVGDVAELFMDLRKQASLELRCGNLTRADELLRESEKHLPHAGSPLEEANWHLTEGELRTAQGDTRGAALSYEHAGNNLARLGHWQRAADVFLVATRLYHQSGVSGRARDLVVRARQLYGREGSVVPKDLVDLEAAVGEAESEVRGVPEAAAVVEGLLRSCASATSAGTDVVALEQILNDMRTSTGASFVILLGLDGEAHRASALSRELQDRGVTVQQLLAERPRLASQALQTLVPLSSEDVQDVDGGPFFAVPVEVAEEAMGCVLIEWPRDGELPDDAVRTILRSMTQLVGIVLQRSRAASARVEVSVPERSVPETRDETTLDNIVGRSPARQKVIEFIRQVRDHSTTVLLLGENGTGKEVVARAVHYTGARGRYPFLTVNVTAIASGLWESELFGHERGSFTDAHQTRQGYFESAHMGTLLLDEIGDMSWEMQTKFLRVLEEKAFTRIGSTQLRHSDVRIIASTNQDLEAAVSAGRFRRDLFHRLNVLAMTLPPLRDRREDIPDLAQHFLELHATRLGLKPKRLSGEALRILMHYPWPGNVRELENAMKQALVLCEREVLAPEDLPPGIVQRADGSEIAGQLDMDSVARWVLDHADYSANTPLLDGLERALARQLVDKIGEKTRAARLLGISKPTLYTRLKEPNA